MVAFLFVSKSSQDSKSSTEDPATTTMESIIAVPTRTPDGRRIRVVDEKVVVESESMDLLVAHFFIGTLASIAWLFLDYNLDYFEFIAPVVHLSVFAAMLKGNRKVLRWMMVITLIDWLILTDLFFGRLSVAVPIFIRQGFRASFNWYSPIFVYYAWPLTRAFTLWIISFDLACFGMVTLQNKMQEEFLEDVIQRKSQEALRLV